MVVTNSVKLVCLVLGVALMMGAGSAAAPSSTWGEYLQLGAQVTTQEPPETTAWKVAVHTVVTTLLDGGSDNGDCKTKIADVVAKTAAHPQMNTVDGAGFKTAVDGCSDADFKRCARKAMMTFLSAAGDAAKCVANPGAAGPSAEDIAAQAKLDDAAAATAAALAKVKEDNKDLLASIAAKQAVCDASAACDAGGCTKNAAGVCKPTLTDPEKVAQMAYDAAVAANNAAQDAAKKNSDAAPKFCALSAMDCSHGSSINSGDCKCDCVGNWGAVVCDVCQIPGDACKNGAVHAPDTCECKGCKAPWSGIVCNECTLTDAQCNHGVVTPDGSCTCKCADGWGGPRCDKCVRTNENCVANGHGLTIDAEKCECTCAEKWTGAPWCDKCGLDDSFCVHEGKMKTETCECDCSAVAPWTGEKCATCSRTQADCIHGTLNPVTCMCDIDCPAQFKGELCGVCNLDGLTECKHGSYLDEVTCVCVGGEDRGRKWKGAWKTECNRVAANCHPVGKGTFSDVSCTCEGCTDGWSGELCATCDRTDFDCVSVGDRRGSLVKETCKCVDCHPGWSGDFCKKCDRTAASCLNGGTFNDATCDCTCPAGLRWKGELCETCSLTATECLNGSELDLGMCKCKNCNDPWKGDLSCSVCGITAADCLHNDGTFDATGCKCLNCQTSWGDYKCHACGLKKEECAHGMAFDDFTCSCLCQQWDGQPTSTDDEKKKCKVCGLDPAVDCAKAVEHGSAYRAAECDCLASCPPKWAAKGDILCNTCDKANLRSKCTFGTPNLESCFCENCKGERTGEFCDNCPITAADCKNGSVFDADGCTCKCAAPWGDKAAADLVAGARCDVCMRAGEQCSNHGTMNTSICKCVCAGNWSGDTCQTCDPNSFTCKFSDKVTTGGKCECKAWGAFVVPQRTSKTVAPTVTVEFDDFTNPTCNLSAGDCAPNPLDLAGCKCACVVPETGAKCNECPAGGKMQDGSLLCGAFGVCRNGRCNCDVAHTGYRCEKTRIARKCASSGDPHPKSWDSNAWANFNYYSIGEFKMYWNPEDGIKMNTIYWKGGNNINYHGRAPTGESGGPSYTYGMAFELDMGAKGRTGCSTADGFPDSSCIVRYAYNNIQGTQCCYCGGKDCTPKRIGCGDAHAKAEQRLDVDIDISGGGNVGTFPTIDAKITYSSTAVYIDAGLPTTALGGMCGTYADGNENNDCDGHKCKVGGGWALNDIQYTWFKDKIWVQKADSLFGECTSGDVWGREILGQTAGNRLAIPAENWVLEMDEKTGEKPDHTITPEEANELQMEFMENQAGLASEAAEAGHGAGPPPDFYSSLVWPAGAACPLDPANKDIDETDKTELQNLASSACIFRTKSAMAAKIVAAKNGKLCSNKLGGNQKDRISAECTEVAKPDFTPDEQKGIWDCKTDACDSSEKGTTSEIMTNIQKYAAQLVAASERVVDPDNAAKVEKKDEAEKPAAFIEAAALLQLYEASN